MSVDYIIAGAGPAGCILAEQLTRNPRTQVLLIEAGPEDSHPFIAMPMALTEIAAKPKYNWAFTAQPQGVFPGETWPRGRALGGSTATNGMIYNRGRPEDYDALGALGGDWNWNTFSEIFEELEDHELGAAPSRGKGGPMHVTLPPSGDGLYTALINAGARMGLATPRDMNAPEPFTHGAIGLMPQNIFHGRRWSASRAFLDGARKRQNLRILKGTNVVRVLFAGRKAIGVECTGRHAGEHLTSGEVILCAGALGSPVILQRSGIGPALALQSLGISPIVDHPAVGQNLSEHRNMYFQFRLQGRLRGQNAQYRGLRLGANIARYYAARSGPMSTGPCELGAFVKASQNSARIDTQILFSPVSMGPVAPGSSRIAVEREPGLTIIAYQLRPESRGSVMIASADPERPPVIVANYLTAAVDRDVIVAATKFVRAFAHETSLSATIAQELGPAAAAQSENDIADAWLRYGGPGCHAAGTCRMGSDAGAVVDDMLRVKHTENLRVVDNSILPFMVSGNTAAPVMASALLAARLIRSAAPTAPGPPVSVKEKVYD